MKLTRYCLIYERGICLQRNIQDILSWKYVAAAEQRGAQQTATFEREVPAFTKKNIKKADLRLLATEHVARLATGKLTRALKS